MQTALAGFILSFSLILAIGAQNAFVLRQGLRREHVFMVCFVSGLSDAILILVGISSFRGVSQIFPWVAPAFVYAGVAFLLWYGAQNFRSMVRGGETLKTARAAKVPAKKILLTCLAMTWLNPHAYLDTLILIGSISTKYDNQIAFGMGAVVGSFSFFFMLGYGARLLSPVFANPLAWRVLDGIVAATMWIIALTLILR